MKTIDSLIRIFILPLFFASLSLSASGMNTAHQWHDDDNEVDIEGLICRIHKGDNSAVKELGDCYHYGRGVSKSLVSATVLYYSYDSDFVKVSLLYDMKELRLFNVIDSVTLGYMTQDDLKKKLSDKSFCAEADVPAFEALLLSLSENESDFLKIPALLDEAVSKDSELGILFSALFYEKIGNKEKLHELLDHVVARHPAFNLAIAKLYYKDYLELQSNNKTDKEALRKAAFYYKQSYDNGFLHGKNLKRYVCVLEELKAHDDSYQEGMLEKIKALRNK